MIQLKAEKRDTLGKKVKSLRDQGMVPAELYGRGIDNIHLSISLKDFLQAYREAGEHSVLQLEIEGQLHPVLVHSVEEDSLKDEILAIDFYEVRMDEKVKTHIPLEFKGEPPAVKEKEGILIKAMDEIEVEALPADLPTSILVNLQGLTELDQSIYVKDLPIGDKYKYVVDEETVVVSVTAPKEEVEEVPVVVETEGVKTEGAEKVTEETAASSEEESPKGEQSSLRGKKNEAKT